MSKDTLKDLYIEQLQDLYSADKQSLQVTRELHKAATNDALKSALADGVDGISEGMAMVSDIIQAHDAKPDGEHCKGMEGLVKEARAHAVNANISDADVRDASIVAQYQRMTHYGLAGYGTAVAFANRLGLKDDASTLQTCLDNTYGGDRRMTQIAIGEVNKAAMEQV